MTIEEIKRHLGIGQVIDHYNLKPDNNNRLHCPWHNDTTPSLQLYPRTNSWTCFSTNCKAGSGDVIDFIMKYESLTKYQAILKAQALTGKCNPELPAGKPLPALLSRAETLTRVFAYFRQATSSRSQQLKDYLNSRGLSSTKLELGYNSGQFHHRKNKHLIESCVKVGVLSIHPQGGYMVFAKHCIIFPLKNRYGEIISLYGRSILDNKSSKHYYLRDTQGLYPSYPMAHTRKLIIPEAVIDTATLLQMDELKDNYSLLSAYGTNRLKEEHLQAIKDWSKGEAKEIIFFFDGDDAGTFAVKKYAAQLWQLCPELTISMVHTPEEEDINSIYLKYGKDAIIQLVSERTVLYEKDKKEQQSGLPVELSVGASNEKAASRKNGGQHGFDGSNLEALVYQDEHLHITVLGGIKISGLDRMKVTLKIQLQNSHYQPLRQHLDLYYSEHKEKLIQTIGEQLDVTSSIAGNTLNALIEDLEKYRINKINSLHPLKPQVLQLTEKEINAAIAYAQSETLMQNTMDDIGKTGIIGEPYNRLIMFLVFLSRITKEPLHIISFGTSGSGKTYLQEKVGELVPEEDKLEITTLSGNALYYFKRDEIKNKLLLIEDYDGAREVLYPLRELQSKQKITKTVSLKDSKGNIKTLSFTVEGPVCIAGCTTREKLYEDNANRSLLIYIDSSDAQDERIMDYQRKLSAGLINRNEEEQYKTKLRNMQRIMKPLQVINPYAPYLVIPKEVLKPRRSNKLYIRFIELITLYHQHQREVKTDANKQPYIETTPNDIAWANKLLKSILLRKSDELSTPCRSFFEYLKKHLQDKNERFFKAKEVRMELKTNASNLKRYLPELHNAGYIKITGGNKTKGYSYEIVSYEEYETLKRSINNVLDELLEKLKQIDLEKESGLPAGATLVQVVQTRFNT